MRRLVPYPVLSLALLLMWLALTRFSVGQVILGAVIAVGAGAVFARLEPAAPRPRRLRPLVRLAGIVMVDVIRSNWAVARRILRAGQRRSAIVEVPLRLRDPVPLALLAVILTATPGTAWLDHDAGRGVLLLHVFDLVEGDDWPALIRDRYEALLLEAFG